MRKDLRYRISNWDQAVDCKSNNSPNLYISVSRIHQPPKLSGYVIKVQHTLYGTLFAAMTYGEGILVTVKDPHNDTIIPFMSTEEIVTQLSKFGFYILYAEELKLPANQLAFLIQLINLKFDKITKVVSVGREHSSAHECIVAYQSKYLPEWNDYGRRLTPSQFSDAMASGHAFNIVEADAAAGCTWDWLKSSMGIQNLLDANSIRRDIDVIVPHGVCTPYPGELMSAPVSGGDSNGQ